MRKRYLGFSVFVIGILVLMTFAEAYQLGYNDNVNAKSDEERLLANVDNAGGDEVGVDEVNAKNDEGRLLANADNVKSGDEVDEAKVSADKVEGNGVGNNKNGLFNSLINDFKSWVGFFNNILSYGRNTNKITGNVIGGRSITGKDIANPTEPVNGCDWYGIMSSRFKTPLRYLESYMLDLKYHSSILPGSITPKNYNKASNLDSVFKSPEELERFFAGHEETGFGAIPNMISCWFKERKGSRKIIRQAFGRINFEYEVLNDDKLMKEGIAHYYYVINKLRYGFLAASEGRIAIANMLADSPFLDAGLRQRFREEREPMFYVNELRHTFFSKQVEDRMRELDEHGPEPASMTWNEYNDLIYEFAHSIRKMEAEIQIVNRQIYDDIRGSGGIRSEGGEAASYFSSSLLEKKGELEAGINALKSMYPVLAGKKFNELYGAGTRTEVLKAWQAQLVYDSDNLKDYQLKVDLFLDLDFNDVYEDNQYDSIKADLDKLLAKSPGIVKFILTEADARNEGYVKKFVANNYLQTGEEIMKIMDLSESEEQIVGSMMAATALAVAGMIAGPTASISAAVRVFNVFSKAGPIATFGEQVGAMIFATDVYFAYSGINDALYTCNDAYDTWSVPVGYVDKESRVREYLGSGSYKDYRTCVTAAIFALPNLLPFIPPLLSKYLQNARAARANAAQERVSNALYELDGMIARMDVDRIKGLAGATPEEKLFVMSNALKNGKVGINEVPSIISGKKAIQIKPEVFWKTDPVTNAKTIDYQNTHPLNKLAYILEKNYRVKLIYDPFWLHEDNSLASYILASRRLILGDSDIINIRNGKLIDALHQATGLNHEILHLWMSNILLEKKINHFLNTRINPSSSEYVRLIFEDRGYAKVFTPQEIITHYATLKSMVKKIEDSLLALGDMHTLETPDFMYSRSAAAQNMEQVAKIKELLSDLSRHYISSLTNLEAFSLISDGLAESARKAINNLERNNLAVDGRIIKTSRRINIGSGQRVLNVDIEASVIRYKLNKKPENTLAVQFILPEAARYNPGGKITFYAFGEDVDTLYRAVIDGDRNLARDKAYDILRNNIWNQAKGMNDFIVGDGISRSGVMLRLISIREKAYSIGQFLMDLENGEASLFHPETRGSLIEQIDSLRKDLNDVGVWQELKDSLPAEVRDTYSRFNCQIGCADSIGMISRLADDGGSNKLIDKIIERAKKLRRYIREGISSSENNLAAQAGIRLHLGAYDKGRGVSKEVPVLEMKMPEPDINYPSTSVYKKGEPAYVMFTPARSGVNRGGLEHAIMSHAVYKPDDRAELLKLFPRPSGEGMPFLKANWDAMQRKWRFYGMDEKEISELIVKFFKDPNLKYDFNIGDSTNLVLFSPATTVRMYLEPMEIINVHGIGNVRTFEFRTAFFTNSLPKEIRNTAATLGVPPPRDAWDRIREVGYNLIDQNTREVVPK